MTPRGYVLVSCWYAVCAALLALMVDCWGSSLTSPRYVIVAGPADWAAKHKLLQRVAKDETWRDEQAHGEWVSGRAALQAGLVDQQSELQRAEWEEAQREKIRQIAALREQAERERAAKDRLRQAEPYRGANLQPMQYAKESPDILGNINRILENASQYTQAYDPHPGEQRLRGGSAFGSPNPASPASSPYLTPSFGSTSQPMTRRQEQEQQPMHHQQELHHQQEMHNEQEHHQRMPGHHW
jgi:hypothetical protein